MKPSLTWAAVVTVAAAWLQSGVVARWRVLGAWPDLVLVVILTVSLLFGTRAGLVAGLTGGLMTGFSAGAAGLPFLVSRVLVAAAVGQVRVRLHRENLIVQLLAVGCGTVFGEVVFLALAPDLLRHPRALEMVGVTAALNALLGPPVAALVARLPLPLEGLAR